MSRNDPRQEFLVYLGTAGRTRVLNDQLADDFHRWYPTFTSTSDPAVLAA
jgi:hypothetical protein